MQSDEVPVFFFFWPVCDDDRDTQKKHLELLPHASLRSELAGLKFFLMLSIFIFHTTTSVTFHACKQEQHHKCVCGTTV